MSDTSKKALIALAGIAILVLAFMYIYRPTSEDIDSLNSQISSLQARLDDLIAKEQQKEQLLAETDQFNKDFEAEIQKYPADLNQENTLMFLKGVEEFQNNKDFINNSWSMPQPVTFYTLGGAAAADTDDALTGDTKKGEKYECISATYAISYDGTYDGLKQVIQYVADYRYRMNISNFNIAYSQDTERCVGALNLNAYAVTGPGREPNKVDLGLDTGTSNLFIPGNGAPSGNRSTKYDADDGMAIVTNNNLVILLNSANSDLSSGIIVASNSNREETYVTSSENSRVGLNISVYSEDGKNFIDYSIGNTSYTAEILTEDVAIYVRSSARVDANDTNGVDVTLKNTTTLPVYFKVVDDDASSKRFDLVERAGTVKVY